MKNALNRKIRENPQNVLTFLFRGFSLMLNASKGNKIMFKKIFLLLLVTMVVYINVSAHSGGTDGQGGHYNRSTGEYHYHHGESEHQHPNGICPYDDMYSGYSSEEQYDVGKYFTETVEDDKYDEKPLYKKVLGILIGCWWLVLPIVAGIFDTIKKSLTKKKGEQS